MTPNPAPFCLEGIEYAPPMGMELWCVGGQQERMRMMTVLDLSTRYFYFGSECMWYEGQCACTCVFT